MVNMKTSKQILKNFLNCLEIKLDIQEFLPVFDIGSNDLIKLPHNIVEQIIADAYGASNLIVKHISNDLQKQYSLYLGRVQKNQLKKYLDYRDENDFRVFINLVKEEFEGDLDLKSFCDVIIESYGDFTTDSLNLFIDNLNEAINSENTSRIEDYLNFIYSRLIALNEQKFISLHDLFISNEPIIKKELNEEDYAQIKKYCAEKSLKERNEIVEDFNKQYINILETRGNHKNSSAVIYFNITHDLFSKFNDKNEFYSYVSAIVEKSYSSIQNHKSFIVKIENIICDEINIKWDIYSYLAVFAEKFKKIKEPRPYYKPELILIDTIKHKFGIEISKENLKLLSAYYKDKLDFDTLKEKVKSLNFEGSKEFIDEFKYIYTGFTFIDCFILVYKDSFMNTKEMGFIENNNEILLVFLKHKIDDSKIPCPICGSLKVSGNSFPEIGIRSWECKNPLCASRSKTNRGKRYSERTIFMQSATYDFSNENLIPKDLTKIWRKDVVESWNLEDLYKMIIKYYSFVEDTITVIDATDIELFKRIAKSEKRNLESLKSSQFLDISKHSIENDAADSVYSEFLHSFTNHFIYENFKEWEPSNEYEDIYSFDEKIKLINGNSGIVLSQLKPNSIDNMVTSPPYYNAREYSQWHNLFAYLNDMYKIIVAANYALKLGGVFVYNIGDIFDNENIIVKSKMGDKRIPLGAYTISLFQKAGFEILDNVIWYKGEPQSNRHKNDGNYTPYYQRPANCYEHMFVFKKKGAKLKINEKFDNTYLQSNLLKFTPVFKIGKGGVNRYGHTAPFPVDVPMFSINTFTNEKEIVLDPFSGSLTSAIAAQKNNRIGVGIEINDEYVGLSLEKARENNLEVSLFPKSSQKKFRSNIGDSLNKANPSTTKQVYLDNY